MEKEIKKVLDSISIAKIEEYLHERKQSDLKKFTEKTFLGFSVSVQRNKDGKGRKSNRLFFQKTVDKDRIQITSKPIFSRVAIENMLRERIKKKIELDPKKYKKFLPKN